MKTQAKKEESRMIQACVCVCRCVCVCVCVWWDPHLSTRPKASRDGMWPKVTVARAPGPWKVACPPT